MPKLYTSPPKFSEIPSYIRQDVPLYRLRGDIYVDDTLFLSGSTIETDEEYIPNKHMFPINDLALVNYRAFLKKQDDEAKAWFKLPVKDRPGFMQIQPQLPAFEREWEKVNNLSRAKGIHLIHAIDQAPSILGAPRNKAPSVRKVDMSMVPQVPFEDGTAIGKGNTVDMNMDAPNAVRASLPVA